MSNGEADKATRKTEADKANRKTEGESKNITGTLTKLKYPKYMRISELKENQILKDLMKEFDYSRNPENTCISICRNGDISPKWMRKYQDITISN